MPSNKIPTLALNGTPLMPTKASRARKWLQTGKAKVVQNDLEIFVIQLVFEPSGYQTQNIACGLDRGSDFTGVAVQSKHETLQGLNLNLPRKQVSKRMVARAVLRRTRRGRRIKLRWLVDYLSVMHQILRHLKRDIFGKDLLL